MTDITHGLIEVPLALRLSFEGQPPMKLGLDKLPCRQVVRSLALALLDQTNSRGGIKTRSTAIQYYRVIRRFTLWLDARRFTGGLESLSVDDLYEYGRSEDYRHEQRLRALLRAATPSAGVGNHVSSELAPHLDGRLLSITRRRSTPLRAYSAGEYDRIVATCRAEINTWDHKPTGFAQPPSVVLAFRILIGLELGIPPESLNELHVQDLRWEGEKDLRVFFVKRRADGRQAMSYRAKGPWSGPLLLKRWIEATDHLRSTTGDDRLWMWLKPSGSVERIGFRDAYWQKKRRAILRDWDLRDDEGNELSLDMRRLRTTWTVRKSKAWHGAITVDPNRTAQVEGDHYLTRSADPDEVDLVVEAAQSDLLRRAEAVALVVSDDAVIADGVDDPELVLLRGSLPASRDQWDMFAAFCRDPYDSPFNPKGHFCTATVWSCLVCPLAIITPGKLPALVSLERHLIEQAKNLTQGEWLRVYGPAWVQLVTRIFPQFSDSTLAAARDAAAAQNYAIPKDPWEVS